MSRLHLKSRTKRTQLEVRDTKKGIEFVERNYGCKFLQQLNNCRKSGEFCDVTIVVGDVHIPAHKTILMAGSQYFRAMFSTNMQEQTQSDIPLLGLEPKSVELVVNYLYSGSLQARQEDVQNLLLTSDMLQIPAVKQMCIDYLCQHISVHNCLDILQLGDHFNSMELSVKAMSVICQRFPFVILSEMETLQTLPSDVFLRIIQSDQLVLGQKGEAQIIQAALSWFVKDPENRCEAFKQAMSVVRWSDINPSTMEQLLRQHGMIDNQELREEIISLQANCRDLPARKIHRSVVVAGGYLQSRTGPVCPRLNTVELLDLTSLEWRRFPSLPVDSPSFVFTFVFSGRLLCLTMTYTIGENASREFEDLLEFNFPLDSWQSAECSGKKSLCDLVYNAIRERGTIMFDAATNKIYMTWHEGIHSINISESEDELLVFDSLKKLPALEAYQSSRRADMRTVVCRGNLYCVGGSVTESQSEMYPQADMYRWREKEEVWEKKASMIHPRACLALVEYGGYIYAIGGFNVYRMTSMERYNPDTDKWATMAEMDKPRSHHSCVAAAGKIYALGGKSYSYKKGGARKVLNLCEVYDIDLDRWSPMSGMAQGRCLAGASVM